ncbi:hypothetical protein BpHYR1_030823 [Brachionus plicatilis]|uniref:Uncharacterized protein n=1 Tax=Brachionus plicatilis TaxID=10195 RepID=A0A3M7R9A9_BRAPC|nr:hypothetical protein BpHYR1_030823 [Brachionus plicatilis]
MSIGMLDRICLHSKCQIECEKDRLLKCFPGFVLNVGDYILFLNATRSTFYSRNKINISMAIIEVESLYCLIS